ncbi:MAG TPA: hypothetical protein VEX35_10355 [Allosphingosinicella sp.]|nr:hypothetical protein [Allosphingosinicella sp.]
MKKSIIRISAAAMFVGAALAPTAAIAQGGSGWGYFYFNDGAGNCGYISCGAYGCSVVDEFPCPREVSGG